MAEEKEFKIKSFTDLNTWQEGHKLVLQVYKVSEHFPRKEVFGLTSQLRRAIVSFTSNIAEGFSRQTSKDKVRFYYVALGSLTEAHNQILIAKDLDYMENKEYTLMIESISSLNRMTRSMIRSASSHPQIP